MRLIAGGPIANRAWAIPTWMEHLAAQTRRPDHLLFIFSGRWGDETYRALIDESERYGFPIAIVHEGTTWHPRHDNERFHTLAKLRNLFLMKARARGADLLLSLDSDIMLEDPETIIRLEELVVSGECDIASCATFFHPAMSTPGLNFDLDFRFAYAYNAGWFASHPGDPYTRQHDWMCDHRKWLRPFPAHDHDIAKMFTYGGVRRIDIPMGIWLGNRKAMECRYKWHVDGEDIGFAQDLERKGVRVLYDPLLRAKHIWDPSHLRKVSA